MVTVCLITLLAISILSSPVLAIQNGTYDNEDHPYVVICIFDLDIGGTPTPVWRTTGFLISPTVVVTAGHGTYGTVGARVSTQSQVPFPAPTPPGYPWPGWGIEASAIYTHPDYLSTPGPGLPMFDAYDVGIVILSEPIILDEYATLPVAGYADTLRKNAPVDLVGYGMIYQERGGGVNPYDAWQWDGTRNYAPANLVPSKGVISDMFLTVAANKGGGTGGTTFGDSGGPILEAGTNTVLGLNSFVTNYNCDGVTYAQRIDRQDILDWIGSFWD